MQIPLPDQLPANMSDAQMKAVILHGIVNPSYPDEADEVLSYEIIAPGHIKALVLDGVKKIDFEIDGEDVTYGLANGYPDSSTPQQFADVLSANATPINFADTLEKAALPEIAKMIGAIDNMIGDGTNLPEALNRLKQDGYDALLGEDLTGQFAEAIFASRVAGIYESEQNG